MRELVDIIYYCHTRPEYLDHHISELERLTPKGTYNLKVIEQPGSAHENLDRALKAISTRRAVVMDDDCCVLDADWLEIIMSVFDNHALCGQVTAIEVKCAEDRDWYLNGGRQVLAADDKIPDAFRALWLPGYLCAVDLSRTGPLEADVNVPGGPTGMSDLLLSLSIRELGWECWVSTRTCVQHLWKDSAAETLRRTQTRDAEQIAYATKKYGRFFLEAASTQMGVLLSRLEYIKNPHVPELIEQQKNA